MKTTTRRPYVSIPPGDVMNKEGLEHLSNVPIVYSQFNQDICAWAGTSNAMHYLGYPKQACAFFHSVGQQTQRSHGIPSSHPYKNYSQNSMSK